jgi:cell division protein FtsB
MRTLLRLAVAIYIGFSLYTLLDIGFGNTGIYATEKLISHREKLAKNVSELKKHNLELKDELTALQESPEKVTLNARVLGYYEEDEGIIRPEGYKKEESFYSVGRNIKGELQYNANEELFRTLSISLGCIFFLFLALFGRKRDNSLKRP